MNKKTWSLLIIIIVIIIIVIIIIACWWKPTSKGDIRASVENFIENVADKGIVSLLEEYSEKDKKNEVTVNENHLEDKVDIEVPKIPEAFLRDSRAISMDFESSGVRRTKPEQLCKKVLERIYKRKFSRVRPTWLRNPKTNRPLELDCYNQELGIALEYNGVAHYKWPNWTGMSKEEFLAQVDRDRYKLDTCDAHGVYLIVVPYNIPENLIPDFIEYQLPHNVQRRLEMQYSSN